MTSDRLLQLLLTQVWQVSLVAALTWLITCSITRDRAYWSHGLWALVLIKAVVPPVLYSPLPTLRWFLGVSSESVASARILTESSSRFTVSWISVEGPVVNDTVQTVQRAHPFSIDIAFVCVGCWLVGAVLVLTIRLARWWRVQQQLRLARPLPVEYQSLALNWQQTLRLPKSMRWCVTHGGLGPLVTGLWRPTVALPSEVVARLARPHLESLLVHEALHIKRGDLVWALVQVVATSLWWFHPLVWFASRRLSIETERCCDEATLAYTGCRPSHYARSLLEVLELKHQLRSVATLPGVRPVELTKERLKRIMQMKQGCQRRASPWQWCWFAVAGCLVLPGGTRVMSQEKVPEAAPQVRPEVVPAAAEQAVPSELPTGSASAGVNEPPKAEPLPDRQQILFETKLLTLTGEQLDRLPLQWQFAEVPKRDLPDSHFTEPGSGTDVGRYMNVTAVPGRTLVAIHDRANLENLLQDIARDPKTNIMSAPKVITYESKVAWISDTVGHAFVTNVTPEGRPVTEIGLEGLELGLRGRMKDDQRVAVHVEWHKRGILSRASFRVLGTTIQIPELQHIKWAAEAELAEQQTLCMTAGLTSGQRVLLLVRAEQIKPTRIQDVSLRGDEPRVRFMGPLMLSATDHEHPGIDEVVSAVTRVLKNVNIRADDAVMLKPLEHSVEPPRFVPLIGQAKPHLYLYQLIYGPSDRPVTEHKSVLVEQSVFETVSQK